MKDIGKEIILVTNRINDGNIFVFDRTGKGLRKINYKGQGDEEYTQTTEIILDEDNNEMFVMDYPVRKFLVYDLYGNFKRSFNFTGSSGHYIAVFNYDRDNLIGYMSYHPTENKQSFHLIISKQDGSITKEIQIPSKEIKTLTVVKNVNGEVATIAFPFYPIIPNHDNWTLVETSSDTVYNYLPNEKTVPLIARIPSVYLMDTEVFLLPGILTDRYYFMQIQKKGFDFATMRALPVTGLVYDKQENTVFRHTVYNDDFSNNRKVDMWSRPGNQEIATWQPLEAHELVESYEKGQLKGKLKEIASKLDKEDNPVIMLIKHKK